MLLSDVIDRINTAIADEDSIKATNDPFTNKRVVNQLKSALDMYANITKGIEGIYSTIFNMNSRTVSAPTDGIRSQVYRFAYVWRDGQKFPIMHKDLNYVSSVYRFDTNSGIPTCFNVWNNEISIYPTNSDNAKTTTLTQNITESDTTITVATTNGFPDINGRLTIGNEKIKYASKTDTTFIGCLRGNEQTTATTHITGDSVTHNNFELFYRKKHFEISVDANDTISETDLAKEMEIPDEHIEPIIDMVAYRLLILIDDYTRADRYKIDAQVFYEEAKNDIEKGYTDISKGLMIGSAYDWEVSNIGATI